MTKKTFIPASVFALLMLLLTFGMALAHSGIEAGKYEIEIGWVDEPAVVGQRNAVIVNITDESAADAVIDVSKLLVTVSYGGQTKALTLEPLSKESKNQYIVPLIPTVAGQYMLQLGGKIGDTEVKGESALDEVAAADTLSFPSVPAAAQQSTAMRVTDFIGIAALLVAFAALVLALRKPRS